MKGMTKGFVLVLMIFTMTGCGHNEKENNGSSHNGVSGGNSVDQVITGQIDLADPDSSEGGTDYSLKDFSEAPGKETDVQAIDGVDYDLTEMSSDMVYAMVYQMMTDPYTYVGKTFRMDGLYYSAYYEPTAQYYHYCIIKDALACCAQGMEFICDDGIHISQEDYPKENAGIVVQGVFEVYQEDGDASLYCRLKDAALEAEEN